MNREPSAISAVSACGKRHYFMTAVRMNSCVDQRITDHTVNQLLIFLPRFISDLIDIPAVFRFVAGKDLIPVYCPFCVQGKIRIFFPEFFFPVFFQAAEHAPVIHVMPVYDCIIIREIRPVQSLQKDAPSDVGFAIQIPSQIFLIISRVENRIIDSCIFRIIRPDPCHDIRIFFS